MLEKLAKQTAVYGISTIVVRFLSYLLTPFYTRIFGTETYGIVTDVYALIPFALVLLSMGMESSYFRFAAKAEAGGGDVGAKQRRLFAACWGATSHAALLFFGLILLFRHTVSRWMGPVYEAHPEYAVLVAFIILFDVWAIIPFSRLREQGRPTIFVMLKALNVTVNVLLAVAFGDDLDSDDFVIGGRHQVVDGAETVGPVHTGDGDEVVHADVGIVAERQCQVVPLGVGDGHHGSGVALNDSLREELAYLFGDISHSYEDVVEGISHLRLLRGERQGILSDSPDG